MKNQFSTFLDLSRWLAAFIVLISHVRHIMLADYGKVTTSNWLVKGVYFVTGLGHEAVMIFFVISGFLVGGLTLKQWRASHVTLSSYFIQRFSRIYTVLIPALCMGFLLDWIGYHYFNGSTIYTDPEAYQTNSIKLNISQHLDSIAFIGNLFMLEGGGRGAPVLGSNAPLWTLAYEWWYYCIFAAAAGMVFIKDKAKSLTCFVWFAALLVILPKALLVWMLIWLLGVLALYYAESAFPNPPIIVSTLLFAGAIILSRLNTHNLSNLDTDQPMFVAFFFDFCIGLTYALLMVSLYRTKAMLGFSQLHKTLASFSYTLYLTHFPLLVFLAAVGHDVLHIDLLEQPTYLHLCYYLIMVGILFLYAYFFSLFTERFTPTIRRFLSNRL